MATMLSIRLTANIGGKGGDNFMQQSVIGGKELSPTVPTTDKASHRAVPGASIVASGADEQAWEAPTVTATPIR